MIGSGVDRCLWMPWWPSSMTSTNTSLKWSPPTTSMRRKVEFMPSVSVEGAKKGVKGC